MCHLISAAEIERPLKYISNLCVVVVVVVACVCVCVFWGATVWEWVGGVSFVSVKDLDRYEIVSS